MFLNSEPSPYGKPESRVLHIHIRMFIIFEKAHLVKLTHVFAGVYV